MPESAKRKLEDDYFRVMLCEEAKESDLENLGGFVGEVKVDGTRCIIERTRENGFRIYGRKGLEYTIILPELTENFAKIPQFFRIDAEIVYIDENGHMIFAGSQKRCQISNPDKIEEYRKAYPIGVYVFDIMSLNGIDLTPLSWAKRRAILENFINLYINLYGFQNVRLIPYSLNLKEAYQKAIDMGFEGIVAKLMTSPYEQKRSKYWVKIKAKDHTQWLLQDNGKL